MNDIKALRIKTGLSQSKFSKKYHIPLKTVQFWEQGRRTPPEYIIYLLEKLLEYEKKSGL